MKTLHYIVGVADDLNGSVRVITERLDDREDFHALISRVRFGTAGVTVGARGPRPTPRSRVTAAGAVGMNSIHRVRVIQASGSTVKTGDGFGKFSSKYLTPT